MNAYVSTYTRLLGLSLAAVALVIAGCDAGGKRITLKGIVTYKGEPVTSGMLTFTGEGGFYSAANLNSDGTFTMTDVIPCEVKVSIMETPTDAVPTGKKATPAAKPLVLPEKFRSPEKSGVKYTITSSTRDLKIELS